MSRYVNVMLSKQLLKMSKEQNAILEMSRKMSKCPKWQILERQKSKNRKIEKL
jgi:hypothetical protein